MGAMALDIDYIGFDTNESLLQQYQEMIDTYPCTSGVEICCEDSSLVDYSKYRYDMVFTSPPYFKYNRPIERYEGMPEYSNEKDFNARFLHPLLQKSWQHLQSGGVYALNIPPKMLASAEAVLGPPAESVPLQKRRRSAKDKYVEYIYVWRK